MNYQLPKLLRPPSKRVPILEQIQPKATVPVQHIEEQKVQQEFIIGGDIHESDFIDHLPQKQITEPIVVKETFKLKDYMEEFFEPQKVFHRQFERRNKMREAIDYQISKADENVNGLQDEYKDYIHQLNEVEFKIDMIEQEAQQMSLMAKLNVLDGNLNEAIQLEKKEIMQIRIDDTDPNEKLQMLYDENQAVIEQYDRLREEVIARLERNQYDEKQWEQKEHDEQVEKQEEDLHQILTNKIKAVKEEAMRLKMNQQLQQLKIKEKKQPINIQNKKQSKVQQKKTVLTMGYGKDKVNFKPL